MKSLAFNVLTTPDKESGLSCLQSACIEGDVDTVSAILNSSPDKLDSAIALSVKIGHNSSHFAGKSILTALRQQDSVKHKQVSGLVEKVTKHFQSQSLLDLAARKGNIEHLRRLLDIGEHVNFLLPVEPDKQSVFRESKRQTPLMLAARFNESDVVEFLVKAGASLEMQDDYGSTPFHYAAMGGKTENILRLIELGSNILIQNNYDASAIHLAATNGHTEAVSVLLEHGANNGANVNECDEERRFPIHAAAFGDYTEVVKFLLQSGGDLSVETYSEETVLHFTTRLDLVSFLVEQGADIHARDGRGQTPLHIAAAKGQSDTWVFSLVLCFDGGHAAAAKALIDRGCDCKLTNKEYPSKSLEADLLQKAASQGLIDVLQLLLDRGVCVDAVSSCGETPLMAAAGAGQCDMVDFLLDRGANINGCDATTAANGKSSCPDLDDSQYLQDSDNEEDDGYHMRISPRKGTTPLYCALAAGQGKVAKGLIERGADTSDSSDQTDSLAQLAANHGLSDILGLLSNEENFHFDHFGDGETLLTLAASRGDIQAVTFLLQKGVDVNAKNLSGDTALCCVLRRCLMRPSAMEIVKLLVSFGADINAMNDRSKTPLQIAVEINFDNAAELLLELGCETKVKDINSNSPLHFSAQNKNGKLTKMLLQYGADATVQEYSCGRTALHVAVNYNSVDTATVLLDHGVDMDVTDKLGHTPLAVALNCGYFPMVQLLAQQGSNVHAKDTCVKTPLSIAVEKFSSEEDDSTAVVKTLLDHGSSVNVTDQYGRAPIHYLSSDATRELCDLLLDNGTSINLPDSNGETPLHFAASVGNTACTEWLLQHGANVGALDRESRTPLHAAASYGGSVELLIQHGANVHLADNKGWLPLHFAAAGRRFDSALVLVQNGADVTAIDKKVRGALRLAARSGCGELVEFLTSHGSDINAKDFAGRPAVLHARDEFIWRPVLQERDEIFIVCNFLEVYVNNGGDIHAIDVVTGRTTLHFAAVFNSLAILDNLLNQGLDLEARDKNGETPLHRAAAGGTPEMIERLVDRGADLSAINNRGQTPLLVSLAAQDSMKGPMLLLKRGSNVQVADKDCNTALHFAVQEPILVKLIIQNAGDAINVNAVNVHGCTALHQAAYKVSEFSEEAVDTVRALLKAGAMFIVAIIKEIRLFT
ncbi:hypothetical protein OS493_001369 [Desmophyllum pertusum]|uniref:Uncharacterized protein n=1 Tax=Desmophyllum pertusum TaxID=174260 RepID=A0A9X0CZ36_9CNID|nr:hypothetical protein OS493_001369 [Desmophyllum pertusum]